MASGLSASTSKIGVVWKPPSVSAVKLLLDYGATCDAEAPSGLGSPLSVVLRAAAAMKASAISSVDESDCYSADSALLAASALSTDTSRNHEILEAVLASQHPGFSSVTAMNKYHGRLQTVPGTASTLASQENASHLDVHHRTLINPRARAALAELSAFEIVHLLLQVGAHPVTVSTCVQGWLTPVHCAAGSGQIQALDALIRAALQHGAWSEQLQRTGLEVAVGGHLQSQNALNPCALRCDASLRLSGHDSAARCATLLLFSARSSPGHSVNVPYTDTVDSHLLLLAAKNGALDAVAMMIEAMHFAGKHLSPADAAPLEMALAGVLAECCLRSDGFRARCAIQLLFDLNGLLVPSQGTAECPVKSALRRYVCLGGPCYASMCIARPESPEIFSLLLNLAPNEVRLQLATGNEERLEDVTDADLLCAALRHWAAGCATLLLQRLRLLPSHNEGHATQVPSRVVGTLRHTDKAGCSVIYWFGSNRLSDIPANSLSAVAQYLRKATLPYVSPYHAASFVRDHARIDWQAPASSSFNKISHTLRPPPFREVVSAVLQCQVSRFGIVRTKKMLLEARVNSPMELEAAAVGAKTYGRSDKAAANAISAILQSQSSCRYVHWAAPVLSTLSSGLLRSRQWCWSPLCRKFVEHEKVVNKYQDKVRVSGTIVPLHSLARARFVDSAMRPKLLTVLIHQASSGGATRRLDALLRHIDAPGDMVQALGLTVCGTELSVCRRHLVRESRVWDPAPLGETALHAACAATAEDAVAVIACAAQKHNLAFMLATARDFVGRTALFNAVRGSGTRDRCAAKCAAVLLSIGVDPNGREFRVHEAENYLEEILGGRIKSAYIAVGSRIAPWLSALGARMSGTPPLHEALYRTGLRTARELLLAGASASLPFAETDHGAQENLRAWCLKNRRLAPNWERVTRILRIDTPDDISSYVSTSPEQCGVQGDNTRRSCTSDWPLTDPNVSNFRDTGHDEKYVPALRGAELNVRVVDLDSAESRSAARADDEMNTKLAKKAMQAFKSLARTLAEDVLPEVTPDHTIPASKVRNWLCSDKPGVLRLLVDAPHGMSRVLNALVSGTESRLPAVAKEFVERCLRTHCDIDAHEIDKKALDCEGFTRLVRNLCCDFAPVARNSSNNTKLRLMFETSLYQNSTTSPSISGALESRLEDGCAWQKKDDMILVRGGITGLYRFVVSNDTEQGIAHTNWLKVSSKPSPMRRISLVAPKQAKVGKPVENLKIICFDMRGHRTCANPLDEIIVRLHQYHQDHAELKRSNKVTDVQIKNGGADLSHEIPVSASIEFAGVCSGKAYVLNSGQRVAISRSVRFMVEAGPAENLALLLPEGATYVAGSTPRLPNIHVYDKYGNELRNAVGEVTLRLVCVDKDHEVITLANSWSVEDNIARFALHSGILKQTSTTSLLLCRAGAHAWEACFKLKNSYTRATLSARSSEFVVRAGRVDEIAVACPCSIKAGMPLKIHSTPTDVHGNPLGVPTNDDDDLQATVTITFAEHCKTMGTKYKVLGGSGHSEDLLAVLEAQSSGQRILEHSRGDVVWNRKYLSASRKLEVEICGDYFTTAGEYQAQFVYATANANNILKKVSAFSVLAAEPKQVRVSVLGNTSATVDTLSDTSTPIYTCVAGEELESRAYVLDGFENLCSTSQASIALELYSLQQSNTPDGHGRLQGRRATLKSLERSKRQLDLRAMCSDVSSGVAGFEITLPSPGLFVLVAHCCVWQSYFEQSEPVRASMINLRGTSPPLRAPMNKAIALRLVPDSTLGDTWPHSECIFIAGDPWHFVPCVEVLNYESPALRNGRAFVKLDVRRWEESGDTSCFTHTVMIDEDVALPIDEAAMRFRTSPVYPRLNGVAHASLSPQSNTANFGSSRADLSVSLPGRYILRAKLFAQRDDSSVFSDEIAVCESRPFDVVPPPDWERDVDVGGFYNQVAYAAALCQCPPTDKALLRRKLSIFTRHNSILLHDCLRARAGRLTAQSESKISSEAGHTRTHEGTASFQSRLAEELTYCFHHKSAAPEHSRASCRTVETIPLSKSERTATRTGPSLMGAFGASLSGLVLATIRHIATEFRNLNVAAIDAIVSEANHERYKFRSAQRAIWSLFWSHASFAQEQGEHGPVSTAAALNVVHPALNRLHAESACQLVHSKHRLRQLLELCNFETIRAKLADSFAGKALPFPTESKRSDEINRHVLKWARHSFVSDISNLVFEFNQAASTLGVLLSPRQNRTKYAHLDLGDAINGLHDKGVAVRFSDTVSMMSFLHALHRCYRDTWCIASVQGSTSLDIARFYVRLYRWNLHFGLELGLHDADILTEDIVNFDAVTKSCSTGEWLRALAPLDCHSCSLSNTDFKDTGQYEPPL